jgi:hypothetical protein
MLKDKRYLGLGFIATFVSLDTFFFAEYGDAFSPISPGAARQETLFLSVIGLVAFFSAIVAFVRWARSIPVEATGEHEDEADWRTASRNDDGRRDGVCLCDTPEEGDRAVNSRLIEGNICETD